MDDKKKKFMIPKSEIIIFNSEDIIVTSGGLTEDEGDSDWGNDDNGETF